MDKLKLSANLFSFHCHFIQVTNTHATHSCTRSFYFLFKSNIRFNMIQNVHLFFILHSSSFSRFYLLKQYMCFLLLSLNWQFVQNKKMFHSEILSLPSKFSFRVSRSLSIEISIIYLLEQLFFIKCITIIHITNSTQVTP